MGSLVFYSVYDRAVKSCGLDFRSAKIWEAYMAWESGEGGRVMSWLSTTSYWPSLLKSCRHILKVSGLILFSTVTN